jgi:alkylmercury lyase
VQEFTVEEVIEAWKSRFDDEPQSEHSLLNESYSLTLLLLDLLAGGQPVSAEQLAGRSEQSPDQIEDIFKRFRECGGEFDGQGNLVGAALTLNPTAHRFLINGKELYTWCALDALFLPNLLGRTAEVASTCPVTGQIIQLSINPEGVVNHSPAGLVLSITIPGVSCETGCCCHGNKTGPRSDACSQMHFFSSRAAADEWLRDRPGVAVLTIAEAWQLAKAIWIDSRIQNAVQVN